MAGCNPLLADSNRASLRELIEANDCWGQAPATGITRARRFTSSSITAAKETAVSDEIRDDRMVSSVIETAATSGGEINWEFAAGTIDMDLQRALMGLWTRPMDWDVFRGKHVSITANNTITIAGGDFRDYFVVGRRLKTSGFLNPVNNDYVQISATGFTGGNTTITTVSATFVAETGANDTAVADANDVVILKNTLLRFNNTPRVIDSTTPGQFTTAVTAGQLVAGQRIFVEGVGYEAGTITVAAAVADDSVTLSDGVDEVTLVAGTDFAVGVDDTATGANLAAKINALRVAGTIALSAVNAAGVVTVTNLLKTGGVLTEIDATLEVAAFAGGLAIGGFYTIVSVTNDAITVDRDLPTLAAGDNVTIKGSMLRNPGTNAQITAQSATIETSFHDVGQHFVVDGLRTGGVSMEVTAGSIVTGSSTLQGRETKRASIAKLDNPANYTVLDAVATEVVSATANVGSLSVNGVEQATAIRSIQFSIEGNLRNQQAVGSKFPVGIAAGRLNITGSIEAYFADGEMYDRFLNHETVSLAFPIIDVDKNTYYFTLPAFKVSSDPVAPGGIDQDVMETMEFSAFRDAATRCMMQIDRFSSTEAVTAL